MRGPAPWTWNPDWWTGYPELQFYPPGFAYAGAVLHALYDRARFDLRLDYTQPPVPPLAEDDTAWARTLVAPQS